MIAVGVASSGEVRREFRVTNDVASGKTRIKRSGILIVPCSPHLSARGKLSPDYSDQNGLCWYDIPKFRAQHAEYKNLNEDQLFDRFSEHAGMSIALVFNPWATVMQATGIAVGIPVAALILGWLLLWAHSGFRRLQPSAH
jgi:hypothetical protein